MPAKIISLVCERACDLSGYIDENGQLKNVDGAYVVTYPCSGMIQPLMIEAALKAGAEGVVVTGCKLGDCYYREGNKMIRERLLGERPPGLKKAVDRRRVIGLWLSRLEPRRFISEMKDFASYISKLEPTAESAAKPATKSDTSSKK